MFERELRDLTFVNRWAIQRTVRQQNIAEHSFYVAMYANDIAMALKLDDTTTLSILQKALWHDVDEIFTGDIPGPNKRALFGGNRDEWKAKLKEWMNSVFKGLQFRVTTCTSAHTLVELILKTADRMEAAMYMAVESALGNRDADVYVNSNAVAVYENLRMIYKIMPEMQLALKQIWKQFKEQLTKTATEHGIGTMITGEDQKYNAYTFYDAHLDFFAGEDQDFAPFN